MPTRSKRLLNPFGKIILGTDGKAVTAPVDNINASWYIGYPGSSGSGKHGCTHCCWANADASCSYLPTFKATISGFTPPSGCQIVSYEGSSGRLDYGFDFSGCSAINHTFCSSWDAGGTGGSSSATCSSLMYWMNPWLPPAYVDTSCGLCDPGPPDLYNPEGPWQGCCANPCSAVKRTLTMSIGALWQPTPSVLHPEVFPVAGTYVIAGIYAYGISGWYVFSTGWGLLPYRGSVTLQNNATWPDNVVYLFNVLDSGTFQPFGGQITISDVSCTPVQ